MDILLIAPPWPLFNRPSIQLATLKAFISQKSPDTRIRILHPYLFLAEAIGFSTYHAISQSSWAAESVAAGLLFPENLAACNKIFKNSLKKKRGMDDNKLDPPSPDPIRRIMADVLGSVVQDSLFDDCKLVGITTCLNQLSSGLYLASLIKDKKPEVKVVMGGTSCTGPLAWDILSCFKQVDYIISGEGELPLLGLWKFLTGKLERLPPGVIHRMTHGSTNNHRLKRPIQVKDLDELPLPDFHDYFRELASIAPQHRFSPLLPIEASRGCWWGRCNFCNLNLQWSGYRAKSPERISWEVDQLAREFGVIDFAFMDNVLPRKEATRIFTKLSGHGRDYTLFAELRACHSRKELALMAKGGLKDLQVGIEALSDSLLRRMNKGASVMDNVAIIRHACESGIELAGNLIIHFPGSTGKEVAETLAVLDFLWPFPPLKTVSYWLGLGSPVQIHPKKFGIRAIKSHPFFFEMFYNAKCNEPPSIVLTYRGDKQVQRRLWRPVEKKVALWQTEGRRLRKQHGSLLTFRDGKQFMRIRQVLPNGKVLTHTLRGLSRQLYLACLEGIYLDDLYRMAKDLPEERIESFIAGLVEKKLLFQHGKRIIGLAVRERGRSAGSI